MQKKLFDRPGNKYPTCTHYFIIEITLLSVYYKKNWTICPKTEIRKL
ncbi:hypothetical protein M23134_04026 [Microscilla marina ATCC 23134]|uniref:Uncharacterized protein n=1 Tax=Microscilla marina ATCC 23134 TaxID=313606 RepID=A1ZMT3_MICM2|nr:hypothetical protein M23134_04026 [Microscilla marina ATCC 23134]